jgi:hypothetical protein
MTRFLARPIYGWGWANGAASTIDVPLPFRIDVDVERLAQGPVAGVVHTPGHEFDGMTFLISCRHPGGFREGQNYNVTLTAGNIAEVDAPGGPPATFGYLMLEPT